MPRRQKHLITAEDLYHIEILSEPRLSPDGRRVVYSQQRVDPRTEKKYSNLWLAPAQGGNPQQFTRGDQNDTSPRWSPDGTQIAFLSDRGVSEKPAQLYLIPMSGGEARRIIEIPGSIEEFSWSPDGSQLVCAVQKTDEEVLEREKDENKKKLGTVFRQYDRLFYKLDGSGYLPKERTHLWTVDVRQGKARQITDHPVRDEKNPAWSPDGKWIAFISNHAEKPDLAFECLEVFVMPAAGGEARALPAPVGEKMLPSFSPDGRWIAYYGTEGKLEVYRNQGLWIVPA
ncbi:MAG TPA: hypothetical protein VF813_04205, partial [Anaerolineaceae bacterium]